MESLSIAVEGFKIAKVKPAIAKKGLRIAARGARIPPLNAEITPKRAEHLFSPCKFAFFRRARAGRAACGVFPETDAVTLHLRQQADLPHGK